MTASQHEVSSQTMPCLSALGTVVPKMHPPSRTCTFPPHSPPVAKHISSHTNLLVYPQKPAPSAHRKDAAPEAGSKSDLLKWLNHCLLVSPKAEIF